MLSGIGIIASLCIRVACRTVSNAFEKSKAKIWTYSLVFGTVFEIFDFENAVTLKTGLRVREGHWKCHRSIERLMTSYWCSIVTVALSHVLSEIFNVEKCQDLEIRVRSLKVIESGTIQQIGYNFLLVLFSNFVPKMHRFWDIRLAIVQWPWNAG